MINSGYRNTACAVLIVSCDGYRDLWGPCITLLQRFWKDCPYRIYLLSNTIPANFSGVHPIITGSDISWSDNVLYALKNIPEEYVLLYIEDLLLKAPVDSLAIEKTIQWLIDNDGNYIRLNPTPPADKPLNDEVGIVSEGTVYRSSVVFSVWKKKVLQEILKSGENAWQFEELGTARTDNYSKFYASTKELMPALNTVIKGVWEPRALRSIQSLGIQPNLALRRVMNKKEFFIWNIKLARSIVFHALPPGIRRSVKALFRT